VSNYSAAVLALSPKRYYRLGETSGTAANDLGSDAQNGTIQAAGTGVTLNQASLIPSDAANASMLFTPGSAGYITLPTTSLPTGASAWSVEAWVKMPATLPASGTFNTVWNFGTKVTNEFVELFYRGSGGHFEVDDWSGAVVTATTTPVGGGTYHFVVTYDGTTCKLYIDGALNVSAAKTFNIVLTAAQIGNDQSGDYWSGNIDEVAWFGSALTLAQIQGLHAAATTAALSVTLAGVTTLSGPLLASLPLPTSTLAGVSTLSGTLTTTASAALTGTLAGVGTLAGTTQLTTALTSTIASVGTLTLPVLAQDTFAGRSVTGSSTVSFGTASDGSAWQAPLWATLLTTGVSGGEGYLMSSSGGAAGGAAFLGSVALRDVDITCRFSFGIVSGNPLFQLCFRGKDANNYTDIAINATTGALTLERWSSGNNASFSMGTFGALTAGTFYRIRVQSDGNTVRAKVWADGTSEPGTFAYTASDTFLASQIAGFFGVGITNVTATTQANGVQFDNLVASLVYFQQQLYVATTGNDTTGNGSSGSPYLTLQRGFDAISPGGTLHVGPGTYTQSSGVVLLARASGTAANRITLQSDTKWAAQITGTNSFTIFECDGNYVDILGFDVSATDNICSYGIVMKGNFCSVQRCYCHDILAVNNGNIGGAGISGQNSGNNYVSGPVDVIGNFITRIGQDGTNTNAPYVHAIYMSCQGGNIWNNLVAGCGGSAVSLGHGASGLHVDNNTFVGCLNGGIALWSGWPTEGPGPNDYTTITNNILAHNIGTANGYPVYTPGIWEDGANVGPHNTYANNLLFDNIVSTQAGWVGLQYQFDSGGVLVNTVFANPQFVNDQKDGSGDYHLKSTSPAINAGGLTSAPTVDYDGLMRPLLGASVDIGAYEATVVTTFIPRALSALLMFTTTPLSNTFSGAGTLTGTPSFSVALGGTLSGTSTLAGPLSATLSLSGTNLVGVGALSSTVQLSASLVSTLAGAGTLSGAVQFTTALVSTLAGAGTLSGPVQRTTALASTLTGAGTLSGLLSANIALASVTIASAGTLTGTPGLATALLTTYAGVGTLSGPLTAKITLPGVQLSGVGTSAATMGLAVVLGTTCTGTGTLTGTMAGTLALPATFLSGVGTSAYTMSLATALTGTLSGVGTLTGTVPTLKTALGCTIASVGQLSGVLSGGGTFAGQLSGTSSCVGVFSLATTLTGSITGTGTLAGTLSARMALSGTSGGTGSIVGTLSLMAAYQATLAGTSTLSGVSVRASYLMVTLPGSSGLSGTTTRVTLLTCVYTGVGQFSPALVIGGALTSCLFAGLCQLAGALSFPGPSATATWKTRDMKATWKTRDMKATWKTRDDKAVWKTRR
jgi:hypothetical protein